MLRCLLHALWSCFKCKLVLYRILRYEMHLHEASSPAFCASGTPKMPDKTALSDLVSYLGQLIFSYYTPVFRSFYGHFLKHNIVIATFVADMLLRGASVGRGDSCYVLICCLEVCFNRSYVCSMWCLFHLVFYDVIRTSKRPPRASTNAFLVACLDVFGQDG